MAAVALIATDFGIEVRCPECHTLFDRVPEERMAYCRVGNYLGHNCIAKQNAIILDEALCLCQAG